MSKYIYIYSSFIKSSRESNHKLLGDGKRQQHKFFPAITHVGANRSFFLSCFLIAEAVAVGPTAEIKTNVDFLNVI